MKNIFVPLLFLFPFLFLSSCEEVIELDLDESGIQTVIEANLKSGNHPFEVLITTSSSYYDNQLPQGITDATVTLLDDEGNQYNIPHLEGGKYVAPIDAQSGHTYTLQVSHQGTDYEAVSSVPQAIDLQEVYSEFSLATPFTEEGYVAYLRFEDPAGQKNYYRVLAYLNGVPQNGTNDLQVQEDNLFDGEEARLPLFQKIYSQGDTVGIELIHLDKTGYDYFNSLSDIISSGGGPGGATAAPGNPASNWTGGSLGYFNAYSSDLKTIVIE